MKIGIKDIIGLEIYEIRFIYKPENEYGLQEFFSFFKLSNGMIFQIPNYMENDLWLRSENIETKYKNATIANKELIKNIKNRRIVNIHFYYFENEIDEQEKAFIELENKTYITEKNFGPIGLTDIDLLFFSEYEFKKIKENLETEYEIKSLFE